MRGGQQERASASRMDSTRYHVSRFWLLRAGKGKLMFWHGFFFGVFSILAIISVIVIFISAYGIRK